MKVYVVEVESGSCEQGGAMLFDSVWKTREAAEEYCKKFKSSGYLDVEWMHDIYEVELGE